MPSLFISHGAPSIAIEQDDFTRAVASFGKTLSGARAIAVVSAHWQARTIRVNAVAHPETIYDFGGFSPDLYNIRYEAPGDPALAREISTLLGGAPLEETRGWDHGLWVPFRTLLPGANVPIVDWAKQFDDWFATHLAARDFETLTRYRDLAPHANLAVPTPEHFEPVFVALGASRATDKLTTIYEGFHYGNLSMRTFAYTA